MARRLSDSTDNVKDAVNSAKHVTGHALAGTRSAVLDAIHAIAGVVTILRSIGIGDALRWVGLARRGRGTSSVALFSAGVAAGAGLGMLFAPMSGADARRAILRRMRWSKDAVGSAATEPPRAENANAEKGTVKSGVASGEPDNHSSAAPPTVEAAENAPGAGSSSDVEAAAKLPAREDAGAPPRGPNEPSRPRLAREMGRPREAADG